MQGLQDTTTSLMKPEQFSQKLLHPRYWLSWLAMGLWCLIVNILPLPILIWLGRQLGTLLYKLGGSRRRIAEKNISLCYPELSEQERAKLVLRVMQETAIAVFESGAAWFWPDWRFKGKYKISGIEHIENAINNEKGVLFLGIHFTTIEIGAAIVNLNFPISGFYRPHKNAIYEYLQAVGRTRRNRNSTVIPNNDVRGIIKSLRSGKIINYAPDQDYGRDRSVFAPFFGVQAATVKAPSQLAQAGKAEVIPWTTKRNPESNKYIIEIHPPVTDRLNKSEQEDAEFINKFIEQQVRSNTSQYLWVHRRFKTRPENEPRFY